MSLEAIGAPAPEPTIVVDVVHPSADISKPVGLHSPPDSNNAMNDGSDSELSDIDEEAVERLDDSIKAALDTAPKPEPVSNPETAPETESEPVVQDDIGEVFPAEWSGTVPVFRPTMKQFQDFKLFMEKVDKYGMKSGIIKIVPPQEWRDSLPPLENMIKQIRVREPIKQDIMGFNGTYRQVNILHQRSYNLPQWRQLCEQSEHQPPARRGERRANAEKKQSTRSRNAAQSAASKSGPPATKKRRGGRVTRGSARAAKADVDEDEERPMTPVSPAPEVEKDEVKDEVVESIEQDPGIKEEDPCDDEDEPPIARRGFSRQSKAKTQSVSARRKYIRREGSAMIDEAAFKDWDYRMDVSSFTPERCEELERIYWKTLTYASPLYGADLPGTLFDESVENWNLNKLPNLLDVLGTKVPGVNTAYLYLGMWKATFAWHLEDVDLYSINYLHFGAPKQWYSISQADARRFEAAMKNIWPTDAKACDQFLRHKGFLISPAHLKQHYNITVNKCVSYPGEFVVTYPYGYHSGYNLGYNCAEAVNFALDSWLPMGKIAKKCQCAQAQDSVWVDVYEIERKLRGEETEYEETEDEDEDDEDDEDDETGLPSPPSSHTLRVKTPGRKRKRLAGEKDPVRKTKRVRVRLKPYVEPPCCLCPNDIPGAEIMDTDDGRKAHRMCALYLPETYIESVDGKEIVANVTGIDKARLDLKCLYCRSKKGACFQCSQKKCPRSYHATCAAAAGVFVEEAEVPVFGDDGIEYKEQAFEFSCRFHRTKRDRKIEGDVLEDNPRVRETAKALKKHDICQLQYFRGDIFAGVVVENRHGEETLLLDIIPNGDRVEVEWKWLLLPDLADYRLPKASANAIAMPTDRKAKQAINAKRAVDEAPRKDDEFVSGFVWAEFHAGDPIKNPTQVKIDFSKQNQVWHYLGKTSTEAKAQYTEDVSKPQHNLKSNFLDSIPKPVSRVPVPLLPQQPRISYPATFPGQLPRPSAGSMSVQASMRHEKPYVYKPRQPVEPMPQTIQPMQTMQFLPQKFALKPAPPSNTGYPRSNNGYPPLQPQPVHHQPSQQQQLAHHTFQQQVFQPYPPQQHTQYHPPHNFPPPPPPPQQQQPHQQPSQQSQHFQQQQQQQQPPKEHQQKKPVSYSSDRFAPVGGSNGFPQLPGLTWPPAHMTSGHYSQPHSRAWPSSVDAESPRPPMTLSATQPSISGHTHFGVAEGQPQIEAYQKYSFFQVHRNRDTFRYRTPYGAGPMYGFVNGYDRNHRAFLLKAQQALNGGQSKPSRKGISSLLQPLQPRIDQSPGSSNRTQTGYSSPYAQILPRPEARSPQSPFSFEQLRGGLSQSPVSPFQTQGFSVPTTPGSSSCEIKQPGSTPLHPAINRRYGTAWQKSAADVHRPIQSAPQAIAPAPPPPRPARGLTPSKPVGFSKQSHSPIPLPPYVRQMTASATPTTSRPSPLSKAPEQFHQQTTLANAQNSMAQQNQYLPQTPSAVASTPNYVALEDKSTPGPFSPSTYHSQGTPQTEVPNGPSCYTQGPPSIIPTSSVQQSSYYHPSTQPQPDQPADDASCQTLPPTTDEAQAQSVDSNTLVQNMLANLRRASQNFTTEEMEQ
ncbi:DNA damage-responsive transcriptional repressor RPH1 [Cladorrhinum sp. PSN259]|nr:DNA damage-responsive transcriptional repressor RPH1 [Cladorrhinum sp. PSN259]